MSQQDATSWHVDKRVPVAIIFGMIAQFAGVIIVVVTMYNDIETNRESARQNEISITLIEGRTRIIENSQARSDERFISVLNALERIDGRLNRVLQNFGGDRQ